MTASLDVRRGSDYAVLARRIKQAGLLERRPGYYLARIAMVTVLYVGGWAALAVLGSGWWALAIAAGLAVAYAQVALVAHDLAHRQVFRSQAVAARAGLI